MFPPLGFQPALVWNFNSRAKEVDGLIEILTFNSTGTCLLLSLVCVDNRGTGLAAKVDAWGLTSARYRWEATWLLGAD